MSYTKMLIQLSTGIRVVGPSMAGVSMYHMQLRKEFITFIENKMTSSWYS